MVRQVRLAPPDSREHQEGPVFRAQPEFRGWVDPQAHRDQLAQ